MNLKSLVNKSIIKSDLRRFWYLGVLFAVIMLIFSIDSNSYMFRNFDTSRDSIRSFCGYVNDYIPIACIFCVGIPSMIFSYMHHRNAMPNIHALPIRREGLYISHLISIAILIITPFLVCAAAIIAYKIPLIYALAWLCTALGYCFVITAFTVMVASITAHVLANIVITYIFMLLPLFVEMIFETLCERYFYGYVHNYDSGFSQYIYLDIDRYCDGWFLLYAVLGIVFLAIGMLCYKKRSLENYGRVVAFNKLNPVFLYSVAMCGGLLGYSLIESSTNRGMWLSIPFGIIGIIIARMIINRSFRPGNIIKPCTIYIGMMAVLYLFFWVDITGFETRIPKPDKIDGVCVDSYYNLYTYYRRERLQVSDRTVIIAPEAEISPEITDPEGIETVCRLHEAIIDTRKSKESGFKNIPITYRLKNGREFKRNYDFPSANEVMENYHKVMNLRQIKAYQFPIVSDTPKEYITSYVSTCGSGLTALTAEQCNALAEAIKKDILAADSSVYTDNTALTAVSFNYILPSVYEDDGTPVPNKSIWIEQTLNLYVYESFENSIKLLSDWGMYKKLPSADSISNIKTCDDYHEDLSNITDKPAIEKIINYLDTHEEKMSNTAGDNARRIYIIYNDTTVYSIRLTELPDELL